MAGSTGNSGWMYTYLLFTIYHGPDTDILQLRICDSVDSVSGECYIWSWESIYAQALGLFIVTYRGKCDDSFEDCGRNFCDKMFRVDFPKKKREQSDKVSVYSFFDRSGIQYSVVSIRNPAACSRESMFSFTGWSL
ncbi:MAG: hypothetical protein ACLRUZ_07420 [Faecalimonas sp.]